MNKYLEVLKKEKLHRNVVIFLVAMAFLLGLIVPRSLSLFQNAASPSAQEKRNVQRELEDEDEINDVDENDAEDADEREEDGDVTPSVKNDQTKSVPAVRCGWCGGSCSDLNSNNAVCTDGFPPTGMRCGPKTVNGKIVCQAQLKNPVNGQ